jgi:hypothetical protein
MKLHVANILVHLELTNSYIGWKLKAKLLTLGKDQSKMAISKKIQLAVSIQPGLFLWVCKCTSGFWGKSRAYIWNPGVFSYPMMEGYHPNLTFFFIVSSKVYAARYVTVPHSNTEALTAYHIWHAVNDWRPGVLYCSLVVLHNHVWCSTTNHKMSQRLRRQREQKSEKRILVAMILFFTSFNKQRSWWWIGSLNPWKKKAWKNPIWLLQIVTLNKNKT